MAKLEKDQFEKFLEQNCPTEEPSERVFKQLQQSAKWKQKPDYYSRIVTILVVTIIGFLLITISNNPKAPNATKAEESNNDIPKFKLVTPEPIDVIASNKINSGSGFYRFMKYKNESFNLSFEDASLEIEMLSNSAELDNI